MTTENKTSHALTLLLIGFALAIAAISKAGSPATDQRSWYLCGSRDVCAIG
jgi:hypothetical protein